jgi:hypothetical protein
MSSLVWTLRLALVAGVSACGASAGPAVPYVPPPTDDGGGTGNPFEAGPTGATPTIVIESPTDGSLWPSTTAPEVRAQITTAAGFLDPASLRFSLTAVGAPVASAPAAGGSLTGPLANAAYTGRPDLSGLAGGTYTLTISAATSSGATATGQVNVQVDAGPAITIVSPAVGSHQKGSMVISVLVDSAPFEPTMLPLEVSLAGVAVELPATGTPNAYQGTVDFRSFAPPLKGQQLLSVAARNANGTRTLTTAMFVVDNDGPTITPIAPLPSDVVGRVIDVSATITDDAGVVDSSVIAVIGDDSGNPKFQLALLPHGGGVYSAPFDTAQLTKCGLLSGGLPTPGTYCIIYPTISFRASDALGNETALAYSFGIDNQPPLLDLNPPDIRISRRKSTLQCSWAFDPLGDHTIPGNMPDDDCAVGQVFQVRARAEDDVNDASFLQVAPLATIDATRIDVYVLNDTAQPLTVDSDGDGFCDLINPKLVPTTNPPSSSREVLKVRLGPVPPQGAADFTPDPSLSDARCSEGDDLDLPKLLCRPEEPTIAISYGPKLPAIWSLEPIEPSGLRCFGNQFDAYANHIGGTSAGGGLPAPGWACIAVQATDMVGNTGVSAPLRVWIDYAGNQVCPAQAGGATSPPPDCTGHYDLQTDAVDGSPCTSRRFLPGAALELCLDGNCS